MLTCCYNARKFGVRSAMPMFQALDALDRTLDDAERAAVERYLAGAVEALRRIL